MLYCEWKKWWFLLPAFGAQERLDAHTGHLVGDTNWKLDREEILSHWRKMAAGAVAVIRLAEDGLTELTIDLTPGALRRQAANVRNWLQSFFGRAVD